jgi:hypothetical protein
MQISELLLEPLVTFVRTNVYETVASRTRACRSALGAGAPMIGASLLYLGLDGQVRPPSEAMVKG